MLKKNAIRRIMVSTLALFIVSVLYFFPNNKEAINISKTVDYIDASLSPIYLLNKDNYVVRTNITTENTDSLSLAKELISALTIGSNKTDLLPKNLEPIIPKNTKILEISLKDNLLKINFSKEFLDIDKNLEEKLIESLVYTLTEIKDIKKIMIFIEGSLLEVLPQSKKNIPNPLTKDFGINKVYDITNIKNLSKTTIYYIGKESDLVYYIPITKINNNHENKIEVIINELKSSPIYETNLISYLASSAELLNYEELENQLILSFNNEIFDDFNEKTILEEVKYSISLSLRDTINAKEVIFKVGDKVIETFKENN